MFAQLSPEEQAAFEQRTTGTHWDEWSEQDREVQVNRAMRGMNILRECEGYVAVWTQRVQQCKEKMEELSSGLQQMLPLVRALMLTLPIEKQLAIGGQVFFNRHD